MDAKYIILNYKHPETNKTVKVRDDCLFSDDNPIFERYVKDQMKNRLFKFKLMSGSYVNVAPFSYNIKQWQK